MMKSQAARFTLLFLVAALAIASDFALDRLSEAQATEQESSSDKQERKPNRLAREKSPYLLQHAYNPVDWYTWGDDAFEKARREDKPILVSIGYSTCHWCHVMEKESFEDPEVAKLMNDAWVSIKVDREERPDLDHIYMTVAQTITGGGGWPLNVLLTPDGKPFFAGTYFPRESRSGRIGMKDLARRVKELWKTKREELVQSADRVMVTLRQSPDTSPGDSPGQEVLDTAYKRLAARFDPVRGGFGQAPKFPTPHNLLFLLRYWKRTGEQRALEMVEHTLNAMGRGGIYDHVGLGFHRYSTDAEWLVPHFEKMLYDQAMLAMAYTEAYQATGRHAYMKTAQEIFEYVLRDMTSPGGGFYSAEDADSEGVEGKFYVWKFDELDQVLGGEDARLIAKVFNFQPTGNFREEAGGRPTGANIPHMDKSMTELALELMIPEETLKRRVDAARQKLFEHRKLRIRPHKDDKILVDWNGLMIAALAKGAQAFDRPDYTAAAQRAADFVLTTMRSPNGNLLHRFREGEAALPAHVDDYAFMVWGLIELYEATFEVNYLRSALELNANLFARFWDPDAGGLFFTAKDGEQLLLRRKEIYDGAIPSGNSVAALSSLRLSRITGNTELEVQSHRIGKAFAGNVRKVPIAHTQLLSAIEFGIGPSYEVVIVGDPGGDDVKSMVKKLRSRFIPNKVVVLRPNAEEMPEISSIAEYTGSQTSVDGMATAYVCLNYQCKLRTTDPEKMLELLNADRP